jgi:hypothetical protein
MAVQLSGMLTVEHLHICMLFGDLCCLFLNEFSIFWLFVRGWMGV